jgi:N-acetylglutamate synthase-like GNAT family acetyltransferase
MIRKANKFDIPRIFEMLRNYRDAGSINGVSDIDDEKTPMVVMTHILVGGGIALVAEKENEIIGMLLAIKSPNLWDEKKYMMYEIAYWVEPEHRNGTAGYRLLKEYVKLCDELVDNNQIERYTMTQMSGQKLNYSRFGLKPAEVTWSS